ncbi:MAG: hypothetical protein JWQ27_449 [Ferruginibacter sp.]|nr:hypothetical protein [Ferruginibacter sp.]
MMTYFYEKNFMYKSLIVVFILLGAFSARAQQNLANSSWTGIANIPSPEEVSLTFTKDSMQLSYQGNVLETMSYSVNKDTLRIQKLSGMSPCESQVGVYTYKIDADKFYIKVVDDGCEHRAAAFVTEAYTRNKQ